MKKFALIVGLLVSIVTLFSCTIRIEIVDPDNNMADDSSFTPIEEVEEKRIATDNGDSTDTATSSTSPEDTSSENNPEDEVSEEELRAQKTDSNGFYWGDLFPWFDYNAATMEEQESCIKEVQELIKENGYPQEVIYSMYEDYTAEKIYLDILFLNSWGEAAVNLDYYIDGKYIGYTMTDGSMQRKIRVDVTDICRYRNVVVYSWIVAPDGWISIDKIQLN